MFQSPGSRAKLNRGRAGAVPPSVVNVNLSAAMIGAADMTADVTVPMAYDLDAHMTGAAVQVGRVSLGIDLSEAMTGEGDMTADVIVSVPVTPPAFVNSGAEAAASFSSSITPTLPGSRVNGNLLLCLVGTAVLSNRDIVFPAGWTVIDGQRSDDPGSTTDMTTKLAYRFVDGTETNPVVTWTGNTDMRAQIFQYSGVNSSSPIGVTDLVTNASPTSTWNQTGINTDYDNSLVAVIKQHATGTTGAVSGYTADDAASFIVAYHTVLATAGHAPDVSGVTPDTDWHSYMIELRGV